MRGARRRRLPRVARGVGPAAADDEGSILPLVIASCALGLAVILMVSAASSLYLERVRLFSLADAAALAGAESFDVDGDAPAPIAADDDGIALPPLTDAGVASTVEGFLADEPTAGLHDLHVDAATTPDGRSARVTLSATWIPPVASLFAPDGVRIDVTSTARSVLVGPGAATPGPAGGG
ncbi:pilus assembly protein TadG-related protein [Clavibacter michiganensis]|uniref:Putative Flp pilus-assembly TadG-like N-terminal domain-containing protein n=1 Tax=Clavibacter michiganensis TaxID=28447 RepID=A0A251YKG0_9MICO|nr:pilus assembly protein TadG-related protein [Clavibacter michiganensis]OUE24740.1 hypothetical protein BFL37_08050 [Clavibacter michiganensis]